MPRILRGSAVVLVTFRPVGDGARVGVRRELVGVDGLRTGSSAFRLGSSEPERFRMSVHSIAAAGASMRAVRSEPVRAARGPEQIVAQPSEDLEVLFVAAGRLQARYGERTEELETGGLLVTRGASEVEYEAEAPVRTLSVVVPASAASVGAADPVRLPDGPLPPIRLVEALRAVLAGLAASPPTTDSGEARLIVHAASDLTVAALASASGSEEPLSAAAQLRRRILGHIERQLDDSALGPSSIARDFNISVRYLHLLFGEEEETVARTIRSLRLDEVERVVGERPGALSTEQLRRRFGFTSAEQLNRGFRRRYGVPIRDYRR